MSARPFVKWVGGKTQLLEHLLARVPAPFERVYHEPFLGGGALYWAFRERVPNLRARLTDANAELINAYRMVRDKLPGVLPILREYSRLHSEELYYKVRETDLTTIIPEGAAARFIYLNKAGFNGLYRVNKAGKFNTPWGKRKTFVVDEENLNACRIALQPAALEVAPFSYVEGHARPGDLVYLDPPYVPQDAKETASFTAYTAGGFSMQDQVDLRDLALRLKGRGVHVMLSNSSTPAVHDLYRDGFAIEEVVVRHNVNRRGDARAGVREVIIT